MAKVELKKPVVEEISANIDGAQSVVLVTLLWSDRRSRTQALRKELRDSWSRLQGLQEHDDELRIQGNRL